MKGRGFTRFAERGLKGQAAMKAICLSERTMEQLELFLDSALDDHTVCGCEQCCRDILSLERKRLVRRYRQDGESRIRLTPPGVLAVVEHTEGGAMEKRLEEAVAKAVARCGGDPQRATKICLEMTERDPFLAWEVQEEAMQAFIEKFVHEAIGDGFSLEDPDALVAETVRRVKAWQQDRLTQRRSHLRVVK
jgi:hypothetical protein